ncbi:tissue-resident T-cell transcription regulator protein ZNF683 isoform X1 [Monodelphis domestica]|uniref:tissue-resident T-cell transcription regulator protein ZNF683 isoform X1 n=2 Tax=Monodelphis domestica TaxID=13616 RepID=UPI0024E23B27|nr:tissue-resident T-cell transcription regulator protein ZNF683 isoform X1 [Monodelphis domestica]
MEPSSPLLAHTQWSLPILPPRLICLFTGKGNMKGNPEEDIPFALYQHQTCQSHTDVGGSLTTPSLFPSLDQQQGQGDQPCWPFKEFLPRADASASHCDNWMYSTKPTSALPTLLACPPHLDLYTCNLRPNPLDAALGVPHFPQECKTSESILGSTDDLKLTAKHLLGKKAESESRSASLPASHPSPAPIPFNMKFSLNRHPLCPSFPLLLPIKPLSSPKTCFLAYGPHYCPLFLPPLDTLYPDWADQLIHPDGPYSLGAHSPSQTTFSPSPVGLSVPSKARDESLSSSQYCSTELDSEAVAGKAGRIPRLGTTARSSLLKNENGRVLYKCNICAKSFRQLSNLKVHFRVHSGERPFQCPLCQKSFTQLAHLQKHQLVHSGDRPYQCSVCHKCFSSMSSLKTHLQLHSLFKQQELRLCPGHTSLFPCCLLAPCLGGHPETGEAGIAVASGH